MYVCIICHIKIHGITLGIKKYVNKTAKNDNLTSIIIYII